MLYLIRTDLVKQLKVHGVIRDRSSVLVISFNAV